MCWLSSDNIPFLLKPSHMVGQPECFSTQFLAKTVSVCSSLSRRVSAVNEYKWIVGVLLGDRCCDFETVKSLSTETWVLSDWFSGRSHRSRPPRATRHERLNWIEITFCWDAQFELAASFVKPTQRMALSLALRFDILEYPVLFRHWLHHQVASW